MPNDLHTRIVAKLLERWDNPLIDNFARGVYVERMIAFALDPKWRLPATAWEAWDMEHPATGARMEVKQSAAQQVMQPGFNEKPAPPSFSIAPKKVIYNPEFKRLNPPRRTADIYVFAWHPVEGEEAADHRHADQWEFYVVREDALPDQKTIGLKRVANLAQPVGYGDLAGAVEEARAGLASLKKDTLRCIPSP